MAEPLGTPSEIVDSALKPKPELLILSGNLPSSAEALRDLLASGTGCSTGEYRFAWLRMLMVARRQPSP